jgi:hypothetical protein
LFCCKFTFRAQEKATYITAKRAEWLAAYSLQEILASIGVTKMRQHAPKSTGERDFAKSKTAGEHSVRALGEANTIHLLRNEVEIKRGP